MAARWIGAVQRGGGWIGAAQGADAGSTASAAGSFSGSGTLAASGADVASATGTLGGSGSLAAVGKALAASAAAFSGSGILAGSGGSVATSAGTTSGSGTLAGSGASTAAAAGSSSGLGTLAASGTSSAPATAAFSGSGGLAAVGSRIVASAGSLAGSGTLAGAGAAILASAGTLSGSGSLAGSGSSTSGSPSPFVPDYAQDFESGIPGDWSFDPAFGLETTSPIAGTRSLSAGTTGAKVALMGRLDGHGGDICIEAVVRFVSLQAATSSVQLLIDLTDPNYANALVAATNSYRFSVTALTGGALDWRVNKRQGGTGSDIAVFPQVNPAAGAVANGVDYLLRFARRGATLRAEVRRLSDNNWFNGPANAWQASRAPVFFGTDASPLGAVAGYYGIRLNPASGCKILADTVKVWDPAARTFYVASVGSDSNGGTSSASPLATIAKALSGNVANLDGNAILGRSGDTFNEAVSVRGINTALGTYGGASPATLSFAGTTVFFENGDNHSINNLKVINTASTGQAIQFQNTDGVRRTGGISLTDVDASGGNFALLLHSVGTAAGGWNGIRIARGKFHDCIATGIFLYETGNTNNNKHYSDLEIVDVEVYNIAGSSSVTGSGIVLSNCDQSAGPVVVRRPAIHDCGASCTMTGGGPAGFFPRYSDGGLLEGAMVWGIHASASGVDGAGIDLDLGTSGWTFRGCYVRDCEGAGVLMFTAGTGNVVRDCVFMNVGTAGVQAGIRVDGTGSTTFVNNTVWANGSVKGAVEVTANGTGTNKFHNNRFRSGSAPTVDIQTTTIPAGLKMEQNAYQSGTSATCLLRFNGSNSPSLAAWRAATGLEPNAHGIITSDPFFGGGATTYPATTDPADFPAITAFDPPPGSPIASGALDLSTLGIDSGSLDFKGNTLVVGGALGAVTAAAAGPATGTFSGSGTLAAVGSSAAASAGTLGGSATLAASGTGAIPAVSAFSGSGTLAVAGLGLAPSAATFAGSGILAGSGTATTPSSAALAGSGVLVAAGSATGSGVGTLSGSGSLSAAGAAASGPGSSAAGSFSGSGSPAWGGASTAASAAAFSGSGSLAAEGTGTAVAAAAAFSGSGTLAAAGSVPSPASASFSGSATLSWHGIAYVPPIETDYAAYLDILARLRATDRFADVRIATAAEAKRPPAERIPFAGLVPFRSEAKPLHPADQTDIRTVTYTLLLVARDEDAEARFAQLSILEAAARNALAGISYGGFAIYSRSRLGTSVYPKADHPDQRVEISGSFAYLIRGYQGAETTDLYAP